MKPSLTALLELFNTNKIKDVVVSKVNLINKPMKKVSSTRRKFSSLKSKAWVFLYELEGDMKNWVKGVKEDVPQLIKNAGFKVVSRFNSKTSKV